jgi:hypothetical protein
MKNEPPEPNGGGYNDVEFHPAEPRSVRETVMARFLRYEGAAEWPHDQISGLKLQAYRIQNRESRTVGRLEYPDSFRGADQVGSIKEIKNRNPITQLTQAGNVKCALCADVDLEDTWPKPLAEVYDPLNSGLQCENK